MTATSATITTIDNKICTIVIDGRIICTDIVSGISSQLGNASIVFASARDMVAYNSLYYIIDSAGTLWSVNPLAIPTPTKTQIGTTGYWSASTAMTSGRGGIYTVGGPSNRLCRIDITGGTGCIQITSQAFTNVRAITSILGSIYLAAMQTLYRIPLDTGVVELLDAVGEWQLVADMTNINGYLYVMETDGTLWEASRTTYGSSRVVGITGQWANSGVKALTAFSDRSLWYDIGVKFSYDFRSLSYTTGNTAQDASTTVVTRSTTYVVNAAVAFTCFASNPTASYLNLTILSMMTTVNGATVPSNITADQFEIANSIVVVQARNGTVLHIYANINETTEAINFKRTLASLLNSYTGVRTDVIATPDQASLPASHKQRTIGEVDATGSYQARYSMQRFDDGQNNGYQLSRSKSEFNHYHPMAQTRARMSKGGNGNMDGDNDMVGDEGEITIDRRDDCNTIIIDGLINARQCNMNTSILGDSNSLPNATSGYSTSNRVGGNSSISFTLTKIITLGCHDPNSNDYKQCFHDLNGYQQLRIEFEPVVSGNGYHSRASRKAAAAAKAARGNDAYGPYSSLIHQIISHDGGCNDRMSCTRLLPEVLLSLRNVEHSHGFTSLLRDIQFITSGSLARLSQQQVDGDGVDSSSFDTGATYRTVLSALITHGNEISQQVLIHQFQNGASHLDGQDHILLSFVHLKQPIVEWSKPLQSAYLRGSHGAALSLGLLVDRSGHQQSRQFLLDQHSKIMKQLHPFGIGNVSRDDNSDESIDGQHNNGHDEKLVSKANILTHSLANIANHNDWSWLHVASSSTSPILRKTCKQVIGRFDRMDTPAVAMIYNKLMSSTSSVSSNNKVPTFINGEPSSDNVMMMNDPSLGISLPFNASATYKKSVGNDQAGLVLDAQYSILAGIDKYLSLEASTNNFVHFNAHLFDQELNIIDAWALFDIREFSNSIALVLGQGTRFERTIFYQELPCVACVLACKGPAGRFGSGQREVYTFTSVILVGPLPIDLSVGLWAGYDFDYQLQFCLLNRPPGFLAGFGASASVYARASAAVDLLVVRGGVSVDLAIFDGSLSPRLTLNLKEACGVANLVISALSGHIDAFYETRGCGHWWNAYSEWCGPNSYQLLSWNGPSITLSWPSSPCYPILGAPVKLLASPPPPVSSSLVVSSPVVKVPNSLVTLSYQTDICGVTTDVFVVNYNVNWKIPLITFYTQLAQTASANDVFRQKHFTKCADDHVGADEQASTKDYVKTGWDRVSLFSFVFRFHTATQADCVVCHVHHIDCQ
jgi:hypothetical protein